MNNPEVVKYLSNEMIPVSGAVETLQPERYGCPETPASKWFEDRAKRTIKSQMPKFWDEFKTLQGFYVMSADGAMYMFKVGWHHEPQDFLADVKRAKVQFLRTPAKTVNINQAEVAQSAPMSPEPSTSVVRIFGRIVPGTSDTTASERSIGRDHMWIFANETSRIVAGAAKPNVAVEMPRSLTARLVRFQLLNNAGNIMRAWDENDVKTADFKMKLIEINGPIHKISFDGRYAAAHTNGPAKDHGSIAGSLSGMMEIDTRVHKITRFRAYGEAVSQGRNDSLAPDRKYPISFAMIESTDRFAMTTPPFWYSLSPMFRPAYKDSPALACWR